MKTIEKKKLKKFSFKEYAKRDSLFIGGHRLCAGCGAAIVARQVMMAASKYKVIIANATGCLEVATSIFPYSSWKTPWIHNAFENAAATISGVEAAYKTMLKNGKISKKDKIKFIVFAGDGGTYDIGLQSLSGAAERGHDFLYVCYNNEAYMNTGIQRSSATPYGGATTTSPAGKKILGKKQFPKDLTKIMVAHNIPYVAQSSVGFPEDLISKVEKASEISGPKFLNVLMPCQLGWGFPADLAPEMGRLAVETNFWPLYEVENGKYKVNYKPQNRKPISNWLKLQKRFSHLSNKDAQSTIDNIQKDIDIRWKNLLNKGKK